MEGRPLLNFSLALSYALSGIRPWGYHVMNLAIHLGAGLALFGIVRRTLLRGKEAAGAGRALFLGMAIALLWTVHPLQTESVTYVIQRAESLMGLCYLLTLYGFIRATAGGSLDRGWAAVSVVSCLAGMASKEVMVSAPLVVFLYDRTFVAGGFRAAWRQRRGYYLALAATWILLAILAAGTGGRSGTAGLGASLRWSDYGQTQVYAIVRYLRLALWPHPLVFDYGAVVAAGAAVIPAGAILAVLLAVTGAGLWRRSPAGFLGAFFFAVLAPTTLVPVATQTMAEHRMYLPLAAVLAALVLAAEQAIPRRAVLAGALVLAAAYGVLTFRRNTLYNSETALWADSVVHWPQNPRARTQLGSALYRSGRTAEAAEQFERSLQLQPAGNADAHYDLGNCLLDEGQLPAAVAHLAEAARLDPKNSDAPNNLGNALLRQGRVGEAMAAYRAALRADAGNVRARANLAVACYDAGNLLAQAGRMDEAITQYGEALRLQPAYPEAEDNWGNALLQEGRAAEAAGHYRAALRLRPDYPRAQANLDGALRRLGPAGAR